jgi:glycerol uptake facilitator protein
MQTFLSKYTRTENEYIRIFLAELIATFLLCSCGLAAVAQNTFNTSDNPQLTNGLSVAVGFGFAAGIGVIVSGKASGSAANPAVSFCSFLNGRINTATMLVSWLAQLLGAFMGAVAVFLAYYDSFRAFNKGMYR